MSLEIYKLCYKLEKVVEEYNERCEDLYNQEYRETVVNLRNQINDLQRKENNLTLKRYGEYE